MNAHTPYREEFATADEFLVAVVRAGFNEHQRDPRLRWSAAAGANEIVPSEGGFAVPSDFALELLDGVEEFSALYRDTDRQPITKGNALKLPTIDERSRATGSRFGALRLSWPNEAQEVQASAPKYKSVDLYLAKLMGTTFATSELFEDVPALRAILARAFKMEAGTMIDLGIIDGPGAGQMLGVLQSGALITIEPESGQAAQTIRSENVVKAWGRLWAPGQRRALWLYNQDATSQIFSLTFGGSASPLVTYGSDGPLLMGRPLLAHEACKTVGALGDVILIDPTQYIIGEKPAEFAESLHLRFLEHEMCFRFSWRLAGHPGWTSALTPLNGTNTVSPFVAIAARQ